MSFTYSRVCLCVHFDSLDDCSRVRKLPLFTVHRCGREKKILCERIIFIEWCLYVYTFSYRIRIRSVFFWLHRHSNFIARNTNSREHNSIATLCLFSFMVWYGMDEQWNRIKVLIKTPKNNVKHSKMNFAIKRNLSIELRCEAMNVCFANTHCLRLLCNSRRKTKTRNARHVPSVYEPQIASKRRQC